MPCCLFVDLSVPNGLQFRRQQLALHLKCFWLYLCHRVVDDFVGSSKKPDQAWVVHEFEVLNLIPRQFMDQVGNASPQVWELDRGCWVVETLRE